MGWFAYYYLVGELFILTGLYAYGIEAALDAGLVDLKATVLWKTAPEVVAVLIWLIILFAIIAWPLMVVRAILK